MYYTYILKSDKDGMYYIGYSENYKTRLLAHNSNKVLSTKNRGPWRVFHLEEFPDEISAIRRERQIKSWKSRKAIEKLKF